MKDACVKNCFSDQSEKENIEVEEKSIDNWYKNYNCCF